MLRGWGCLREARRLAGRAPGQGAFIPFYNQAFLMHMRSSAFAAQISCYRSMAAMTLEGLDDEPHQERRSGAHASSLAFAFVLGIIAGQALPCGKLSFDGLRCANKLLSQHTGAARAVFGCAPGRVGVGRLLAKKKKKLV